jgi:hypothetical protein
MALNDFVRTPTKITEALLKYEKIEDYNQKDL